MLKKAFGAIVTFLIAITIASAVFGINGTIARKSVPLAVLVSLLPPLYLEEIYTTGNFQGLRLGSHWGEVKTALVRRSECRYLSYGRLVEIDSSTLPSNPINEIILRCSKNKVSWNEILVFENETLVKVSLAAGFGI